jgi:hypothetical protein
MESRAGIRVLISRSQSILSIPNKRPIFSNSRSFALRGDRNRVTLNTRFSTGAAAIGV